MLFHTSNSFVYLITPILSFSLKNSVGPPQREFKKEKKKINSLLFSHLLIHKASLHKVQLI